jgi:hypothetical protein
LQPLVLHTFLVACSCDGSAIATSAGTAITVFELLMMGGVLPETCWAIKKHWNNKFYNTVASCWLFLWELETLNTSEFATQRNTLSNSNRFLWMFFCFAFFVFGEKISCDIRNWKQLLEDMYKFEAFISCNYIDFITDQEKNADQRLETYNQKLICIDNSLWQISISHNLCDYRVGQRQDKVPNYYI